MFNLIFNLIFYVIIPALIGIYWGTHSQDSISNGIVCCILTCGLYWFGLNLLLGFIALF